MKNIKKGVDQKFFCLAILCLSFVSMYGSALPQARNNVNFISDLHNNIETDTFPFFKKSAKPLKIEESENSMFPDSKAYREPVDCKIAFDGKDPGTGERKKELYFEPLLSYTSAHIKPYVPGKDLLSAEGKLIKISGGYTYLLIKFHWDAKNPQNAYGSLKANGAIRCQLTHGKSITLYNKTESLWQMDGNQATHVLQSTFLLHPRQIKLLEKYPLMKMTVYWERGFEEYPIYPIGFFMDQLKCLD